MFWTHSIDQLLAKVNAHKLEANLADLVRIDPHSTTNTVTNTHWTTPLLLATSVIVILVIVYYCTSTHGKVLLRGCVKKESRSPTLDPVQAGSSPTILPSSTPTVGEDRPSTSDAHPNFAIYAVHDNWTHSNTRNSEADSHLRISKCSVECWNIETVNVKHRKVISTHVIRINVFVCSKTRVAVQCSGKSRARR